MGRIRRWERIFQTEGRLLSIAKRAKETTDKVISNSQDKNLGRAEIARGRKGEDWQEITGDQVLTNLVTHIREFRLFLRIMGKEEILTRE